MKKNTVVRNIIKIRLSYIDQSSDALTIDYFSMIKQLPAIGPTLA